jgi:formate dehydrogenase subunit gamma
LKGVQGIGLRAEPEKVRSVTKLRAAPSNTAAAPPDPASPTHVSAPQGTFVSIPVIAIFEVTPETRTFRIARPMGFDLQPGQFLTVAMKIDGSWTTARYPVTSTPESFGYLEISVERRGLASSVLHSSVGVGSLLAVAPMALAAAPEATPAFPAPLAIDVDTHTPAPPPAQILLVPRRDQVKQILRFARGEMMLHWSIALPFMVCFATGVTMKFFYNLHSDSLFREALSFLHRVAGGCLAVFPGLAILRNWRDYKVHIHNVKVGFSWTIDDLKWLFLVGPATVSKRIVLPEQRKFNAAERLNFMMVLVTYPLFVGTGLFLVTHGVDHFLPWVLHISMSLVAPLLMFGHIYMAVVNPSTRVGLSGMLTGRVDREWAKHHYQRWYRENFEEDGTPKR